MTAPRDRLALASEFIRAGRWDQAAAELQRFLTREPGHAIANGMMAFAMSKQGEPQRAVFFLERALVADPTNLDLLHNLANARLALGDDGIARGILERIVAADPDRVSSAISLTALLSVCGRVDEAEALCTGLLRRQPGSIPLLCNLAGALRAAGRIDEAVGWLRKAQDLDPSDAQTVSALAQTLTYTADTGGEARFAAHARYGELAAAAASGATAPPPSNPDPERRLRVGLVSADLRAHSVAFFVEPWFEHRDRGAFGLACYSAVPLRQEDAVTRRLRACADEWRHLPAMLTYADTARMIRGDRIDILIDLSGHTAGHRLPVFAMRPAPIQVTYLGYPDTTGLGSMDYRLVDGVTDPPGSEGRALERLWRLDPCFLCYRPPAESPAVVPPETGSRGVVFGSFNAVAKYTEPTLSLWARVLRSVPGSRLVLKNENLASPNVRALLIGRFASAGIEPGRIELLPRSPSMAEHLACYNRIDVALDPVSYNGTTTTCEALLMGVPVITLTGARHASRVGTTLLRAAGIPELVADDEAAYIRLAAGLAADAPRLRSLRESLRSRLASSVLCDGRALSKRLEAAFRAMWRERCGRSARP